MECFGCGSGYRLLVDKIIMKYVVSGLESSGKSLKLAMICQDLVIRNAKWNKITGLSRPIISNMAFSKSFLDFAKEKGVELLYWHDLEELIKYQEADIICDEIGNYFDSRMWADLSLDVRRWLTQGAKTGIEFYGGAQDFAQVDKAFRRLVQPGDLHHITKIAGSRRPAKTKPPVRLIWGICLTRSLNPQAYDEDKKEFADEGILGMFNPMNYFLIRKSACMIFDTGQKIERSASPYLMHIKRMCQECGVQKISHV